MTTENKKAETQSPDSPNLQKPTPDTTTLPAEVQLPETVFSVDDLMVKQFYADSQALLQMVRDMEVKTVDDFHLAQNRMGGIYSLKKELETQRTSRTKPLQSQLKQINDSFKILTEPIQEADTICQGKVMAYKREQDRLRAEAEAINRMKVEAAEREAKLHEKPVEDVQLVAPIAVAPDRVLTDSGADINTRKIKKWRVIDQAKVPEEYKIIDNGRVTKAVKGGIGEIPGIEIYIDEVFTREV